MKPNNLKPHLKKVYDLVEEKAVTAEDETDILSISEIASNENLDITRQTASKRLERLEDKGLVEVLPTPSKSTRYVPADFDKTLDPVKQRKEKLREARKNLKERILREPTVAEVTEELGEPFNDRFEKEFIASVENYRRPSEEQIESQERTRRYATQVSDTLPRGPGLRT